MVATALKRYVSSTVGAAIFLGVFYTLGFGNTWRALAGARFQYIGLTLVLFVASSYLRMYKWVLMRDRTGSVLSFSEINGLFFFSKFWGLVSPMRSGEIAPALFRSGKDGQRGRLLSIILYDRVIETFQSLTVFVAMFFLLYGELFDMSMAYALAAIFVVLAMFSFVMVSRRTGERVFAMSDAALGFFDRSGLARSLRKFLQGARGGMEEFYESTKSYFTPWFSLYCLFITFVCWGIDMIFWIVLFRAFQMDTSILVTLASVTAYTMVAAIAPTPNGLGISDLSFALILKRFGYLGEVGGLIIVSRILVLGYTFFGYLLFAPAAVKPVKEEGGV